MLVETPIVFHSRGVPLSGRFIRNTASLRERQPAVIALGSWLTVKEQMATTYARQLAEAGYTAFVFDYAGFGESRGEPRQAEIPARKLEDIRAAAEFLQSMAFIEPARIACLGICASAQYVLAALAAGAPIRAFASVAGWYHDPASVAPFYGGEVGVELRLERARNALESYVRHAETRMAPAYKEGDERAGMYFHLDYYAQAERGAVPAWSNEMAEITWLYWLTFDGLRAAQQVSTPSLFVHSSDCVFPDHVKRVHSQVQGPKELIWSEGSQIDFDDQPKQLSTACAAVKRWFGEHLST
jgi:uncharacterized protein